MSQVWLLADCWLTASRAFAERKRQIPLSPYDSGFPIHFYFSIDCLALFDTLGRFKREKTVNKGDQSAVISRFFLPRTLSHSDLLCRE